LGGLWDGVFGKGFLGLGFRVSMGSGNKHVPLGLARSRRLVRVIDGRGGATPFAYKSTSVGGRSAVIECDKQVKYLQALRLPKIGK